MPDINFTFGLDFGTSKTAITLAKTGVNNPNVEDLLVEGQADRIPTCVLRDKTTGAIYIGAEAEQEYQLQRDPVARANFEFFSNFKPQIHQGDAYRPDGAALSE